MLHCEVEAAEDAKSMTLCVPPDGGHLHLGVSGIDGFEMDGNSLCSVWLAPVLVGFAM